MYFLSVSTSTINPGTLDTNRQTFIGKVGELLAFLGGKMEWFQLLILFAQVAAEKTLWHRMTAKNAQRRQSSPTTTWNNANIANVNPIGFNTDANGNVRSAAPPRPVNGLPNNPPEALYHNVPQPNAAAPAIGSDQAVKHYKTLMGREIANLKNENGNTATVCGRLRGQITEFSRIVEQSGFDPQRNTATDFYIYLESIVFPELVTRNRSYTSSAAVLKALRPFIDEAEYNARQQEQPRA